MSEMHEDTHHDAERAPELADLHLQDKPDGPAAAAIMAVGIGVFALGLLVVLAEVSESIKEFLEDWEFGRGVGPLAGKTTIAVIAWAVSWAILAMIWRGKDLNLRIWFVVALALGILGAVGSFPPFFLLFE
jgi:hypothetical protein